MAAARQRRHVLAEVDGEVGNPEGLVGRQRSTWHLAQDTRGNVVEPRAIRASLRIADGMLPAHTLLLVIVAVVECAILADDAVDRPEPCNQIAPSRRAPGDRNDSQPRRLQSPKRVVRRRLEPAIGGQRIVDVEQNHLDSKAVSTRQFTKRSHGEQNRGFTGNCTWLRYPANVSSVVQEARKDLLVVVQSSR